MQLYHASQDGNISVFEPRLPTKVDLGNNKAVVWAVSAPRLYNYLLPRDCPRISFFKAATTSDADADKFMLTDAIYAVILVEQQWLKAILETTLYLYEFDPTHFYLLDDNAGYYLSEQREYPLCMQPVTDLFAALFLAQVEIRLVQRLKDYVHPILHSSLGFSMIRMQNAKP